MPVNALVSQYQFSPTVGLQDGQLLNQLSADLFSTSSGVTALAGGGQVGATPVFPAFTEVDTVVTNNDSVMLPPALPGQTCVIYNATAQIMSVYGQVSNVSNAGAGDTIASASTTVQQPTATGVTQAASTMCMYVCMKLGQWKQGILL